MFEGFVWRKVWFVPGLVDPESVDSGPDWRSGFLMIRGLEVWWIRGRRGVCLRLAGLRISASRRHIYIARIRAAALEVLFGRLSARARLEHLARGTLPWPGYRS